MFKNRQPIKDRLNVKSQSYKLLKIIGSFLGKMYAFYQKKKKKKKKRKNKKPIHFE
jgi:hypothetical protein